MYSFLEGKAALQLRAALRPRLLLLVPQHTPQNLTAGAFWHNVNEIDAALQALVPCLVIRNVFV